VTQRSVSLVARKRLLGSKRHWRMEPLLREKVPPGRGWKDSSRI
jgi:hypothetical protein